MCRINKILYIPIVVIILFVISFAIEPIWVSSKDMAIEQAVNIAQIGNKELNKITINLIPTDEVSSFNIYLDNELLANTTDSKYTIDNLTSGNLYNIKIEFLNEQGEVIETQDITDVSTAKVINSFNESITLPKDTYYINTEYIWQNVVVNVEAGSILKMKSGEEFIVYRNFKYKWHRRRKSIDNFAINR